MTNFLATHLWHTYVHNSCEAKLKSDKSRKKDMVKKMLVSAQGKEACYIVRALQGKMRLGLAESTVLVALAHAVTVSPLRRSTHHVFATITHSRRSGISALPRE